MGIIPRDDMESCQIGKDEYHRRHQLQHLQKQPPLQAQEQEQKLVSTELLQEESIKDLALNLEQENGSCPVPDLSFLDCWDAILLFSCFRGVPVFTREPSKYLAKRTRVTVKVEATVVRNDVPAGGQHIEPCNKATNRWRRQFDIDTKLNESAFVGTVLEVETKDGRMFRSHNAPATHGTDASTTLSTPTGRIQKGTLVTSIRKCATKARLVTMPVDDLIAIPGYDDLDMGEVAALVSTYLPAFGALYHGLDPRIREGRYSKGSLTGCTILISGGRNVEAEAIIKLALLGGASRISLFQTDSGMALEKMCDQKVFALCGEPEDHVSNLYHSMDIVIDLSSLLNLDFLRSCLSPKGRLVCVAPKDQGKSLATRMNEIVGQATLFKVPGSSIFDFQEMSKSSYDEVIRDLQYLLDLTQKRKLRPRVDRYIKPRDVEIMQEDMVHRPPRGAVICEPWREHYDPDAISSFEQLEAWSNTMCAQSIRS